MILAHSVVVARLVQTLIFSKIGTRKTARLVLPSGPCTPRGLVNTWCSQIWHSLFHPRRTHRTACGMHTSWGLRAHCAPCALYKHTVHTVLPLCPLCILCTLSTLCTYVHTVPLLCTLCTLYTLCTLCTLEHTVHTVHPS